MTMTNALSPNQTSDPRRLLREVTDSLRRLRDLARRLNDSALAAQLDDSLERIESQRFTIAVAGEFKRGKSTFVNALLGADVLPSNVAPASAALTRVTYGNPPQARIQYRAEADSPPREEMIAIEQLKDFVTKLTPESQAIAERIQEAIVSYPSPFCRIHRIDVLDTPGLGDESAMTEVTLASLPRVDGVIMMVLAESPFGESEGAFLEQLLAQGFTRIIFVVTAMDRLESEDRPSVIDLVKRRVNECVSQYAATAYASASAEQDALLRRFGTPRVFGISGYQALRARRTNNATLEAESGFKEFLDALDHFLTHESEGLALQRRVAQIRTCGDGLAIGLDERMAMLEGGRPGSDQDAHIPETLLGVLLQLGGEELQRVANAYDQARTVTAAQLGQLTATLKAAVSKEIAAAKLSGEELETQYAAVSANLSLKLRDSARQVIAQSLTEIGAQVDAILEPILRALRPFAVTLSYVLTFVAGRSDTEGFALNLPPRIDQLRTNPELVGTGQGALKGSLAQIGPQVALPWIEAALQAPLVRECLTIPVGENTLRRGMRRLELPTRYKQALSAAIVQEIDRWHASASLDAQIAAATGASFSALRQEIGMVLGMVNEQQRVLERERERRAARNQHELKELGEYRAEIDRLIAQSHLLLEQIEAYTRTEMMRDA
jgi:hypothetical protein